MSVDKLLESMTPEVYEKLKTAVELGKWENGAALTQAQKDSSLQAVMLYQSRFNTEPEHFTIGTDGEIAMLKKAVLKQQFRDKKAAQEEEILRVDVE
ncbi:DUF1315 family protein [Moritella sp. 5]|uniref:YeaC family protein n=1 Tax=Moritella sp. 5 TaxID=2746231 RepID=UPI001BA6E764|nr:DUF1315 family protein [Moritella sp. 5]QUM79720.1 DUF1315 family protein [Moritella sp. 5]